MIIFFINQYWSSEKRLLNVIINKLFIHAFVLLLRLFLQREGGGWAGERSASLPLWSALVWSVSDAGDGQSSPGVRSNPHSTADYSSRSTFSRSVKNVLALFSFIRPVYLY